MNNFQRDGIKAVQFTGKNKFEVCELFKGDSFMADFPDADTVVIQVSSRKITVRNGDYVVKDNGQYYICDSEYFNSPW